ncbi:MAG: hypothetical protein HY675_21330 [Chloroflexi bacterium]|nr:hypothetical protein [Chloroflexota bacterium]
MQPDQERADREGFYSHCWRVFSAYTVADGVLRGSGDTLREYAPAAYPQIITQLANLCEGDEIALVKFASTWGHLGYLEAVLFDESLSDEKRTEAYADVTALRGSDPLHWIWAHARGSRMCLELLYYLKREDDDALDRYIQSVWHAGQSLLSDKQPDVLDRVAWPVIPYGERNRLRSVVYVGPMDAWRPCDVARSIILDIVNSNLPTVRPHLDIVEGSKLILGQYSPNLLGIAYWHLARMVVSELGLARCLECKRYFHQTDKRQDYCPPDEWEAENARKRGMSVESRCAKRARMRRLRQKSAQ